MNPITWSPGVSLEALIQQVVEAAMFFYKGNKTAVAQSLGIAVRTLDNRLEKYAKEKTEHEERVADARTERQRFVDRQRGIPVGAQFDNSASPSIWPKEIERRNAQKTGLNSATGLHPQSLANAATERTVPVPEPQEIQGVLPTQSAGARNRKNG